MSDKEKAEVMLSAHEGRRIEFKSRHVDTEWKLATVPNWNWVMFEYRVASEKPEPLELWVNVKGSDPLDRVHYTTKEAAMVNANDDVAIRTAVHMREVETVEPLEAGVWHVIAPALTIRLFPESKQILIRDEDEELSVVAHIEAVPDLITALQGLIEEES